MRRLGLWERRTRRLLGIPARADSAAVAAPSITSISPDFGDAAGGVAVTITGTGFTGATGGTINGVALTSFVAASDTTITAVTPAIASSNTARDLVVTGPGGSDTLSAAYTSWDISSLATAATAWWRGSYGGSPWSDQITSNDLAEATNAPAVGSAVNGWTPADCDGTNDVLKSANDFISDVSAGNGSVLVLFNADTAAAAAANAYDDPPLVCDDVFSFNLGFSDGGVGLAFYDGVGWQSPTKVSCTTSAWHFALCRWNGTSAEIGVDQGSMNSVSTSTFAGAATYKTTLGAVAISASAFFDGKIMEVILCAHTLADADRTKVRKYFNTRYGLSL